MPARDRTLLFLLLALTFSTGVIDAVGYLGLDRVFTGNMTGNVVILGMALVGDTGLPVLGPVVALVGFVIGAAIAGRLHAPAGTQWTGRTTAMFGAVGAVLGAAVVTAAVEPTPGHALAAAITTSLGLAMGAQAAVARQLAVADITTVVVTSTITGLAADTARDGRASPRWARRLAAIVLIGAGACAGAAALLWSLAAGIALSALLTVVVAAVGHWRCRER